MRNIKIGFHLLMLVLVVICFAGGFSPAKTGNFAQDNGGYIMPLIGIITLWVIGAIVLRVVGAFTKN